MSKLDVTREVVRNFNQTGEALEANPLTTGEMIDRFHMASITASLADISLSLAMIADAMSKEESDDPDSVI